MPSSTEAATGVNGTGTETGQSTAPGAENGAAGTIEQQLADAERRGAERARSEATASYRGIQRTLSQVQAENAQLREQSKQLGYIPAMAEAIKTLTAKTLGPEESQLLDARMENERLKALNTAAQAQSQFQQNYPQPQPDERSARTEILQHWFPETELTPEDRRIDWAQDAQTTGEAQARFRRSVLKAEREDAAKGARDEAEKKASEVRNDAEGRLRDAGIDRIDRSAPGGPVNFQNNALTSQNPIDWDPRKLMKMGFESQEANQRRALKDAARARPSA